MHRPERRLIGRAFSFWHQLCGKRVCPTLHELAAVDSEPFLPYTFMIDTSGKPEDYTFQSCGTRLLDRLQVDLAGVQVGSLPIGYADNALDLCRAAVTARKPVANSDQMLDRKGNEILYRLILLPVSDNGDTVNALMGAANFKDTAAWILDSPPRHPT